MTMQYPREKLEACKTNLYGYLCRHAERNAESVYIVSDDGAISYGEALGKVRSLASDFLAYGVKKGDLAAIRATRSPGTVFLLLALCAIGAVAVTTDAHFFVKEYIADSGVDIRPDWWITNEDGAGGISAGDGWRLENNAGVKTPLSLTAHGGEVSAVEDAASRVAPEDLFMIIFTSGSTGKSKAVTLSHRAVIANPVDAMPLFAENASDVAVSLLPLNHVFGFAVIACATFCGHSVVFPPETDKDTVLGYIEKYRVSCIYSVPTFFLELLSDGRHKKYDISSLRLGLMAGGPFTESQLRFIEGELGIELMPGYGMSECVGISTTSYGDDVKLRAAGVGKPYPMTEVFILDECGRELAAGETGEICVRGMTMMSGYYKNEEATRAVYDEKNRLHTGDLGYFDESGILHVNGRKKDIIIRGGENISAAKIEKALLACGYVYQAVAVGLAHEKYGEVPCAAVVLCKGVTAGEKEIKQSLCGALSKHEIPERVIVLNAFPLTSSGKPDKQKIKELF